MDPNACLKRILDAFDCDDFKEAEQAVNDLSLWLFRGGFAPTSNKSNWLAILAIVGECAIRNQS